MTHKLHKDLKPEDFKRLYGVNQGTFNRMVNVLHKQVEQKKKKPGEQAQIERRRPGTSKFGVLAGVPHILPH